MEPTAYGKDLMKLLAVEIGKLPNTVTMEGHTDSKAYTGEERLFRIGSFRRTGRTPRGAGCRLMGCARIR